MKRSTEAHQVPELGVHVESHVVELRIENTDLLQVEAARLDLAAFAPLYRDYARPVFRYFYQQVGCVEDAEDLTATTFSKALISLSRFRGQSSFATWLFSIARYTLIDHRRSAGARTAVELPLGLEAEPELQPEDQAVRKEGTEILRAFVRQLPPDQQEAVVLRIFCELRIKDVAELLGKGEGAVKMLMHRALRTLRAQYAKEREL